MMRWLNEIFKHRIVLRYLQLLPKHLIKQHGKSAHYSTQQILRGIKRLNLSEKYAIYAIAALGSEAASKLYAAELQLNEDAILVRHQVADLYLDGNRDFTIDDINIYAGVDDSMDADHAGD